MPSVVYCNATSFSRDLLTCFENFNYWSEVSFEDIRKSILLLNDLKWKNTVHAFKRVFIMIVTNDNLPYLLLLLNLWDCYLLDKQRNFFWYGFWLDFGVTLFFLMRIFFYVNLSYHSLFLVHSFSQLYGFWLTRLEWAWCLWRKWLRLQFEWISPINPLMKTRVVHFLPLD